MFNVVLVKLVVDESLSVVLKNEKHLVWFMINLGSIVFINFKLLSVKM